MAGKKVLRSSLEARVARTLREEKDFVWVAAISNEYGISIFASWSEAGLSKKVAGYCEEWWTRDVEEGVEMPKSDESIISEYFSNNKRGERCEISRTEID